MTSSAPSPRPAPRTRRWPDVLIGTLVLLLLGGFGALMFRGQPETAPAPVVTTEPAIPAAPGVPQAAPTTATTDATAPVSGSAPVAAAPTPEVAEPAAGSVAAQPSQAQASQAQSPQAQAPRAEPPAGATGDPALATQGQETPTPITAPVPATATPAASVPAPAPTNRPEIVQATPIQPATLPPDAVPDVPSASTLNTNRTGNVGDTPAAPAATAPAPQVATGTPRTGGAVPTSAQRTPLRSDYRISLGSFATARTVGTQTAGVRGLGYTVHPIDLGDQVVAQIGPFADETSAQQALADIQRVYPGALLYPPRGVAAPQATPVAPTAAAAPAPPVAAPPAAAPVTDRTPATPSQSSPAPAAAPATTPTYLQVGAFDRVESAQTLVQQLRDLGYEPNVNAPEGRKVTVSVGPYIGDALRRTEDRLDEKGLDHFRVR